jgi:uncharacterized protein YkwD
MTRALSLLILCVSFFIIFSPHQALAKRTQNSPTFFSFFKNYVLAYTAIVSDDKHVLAEQTQTLPTEPIQLPQPTIIQTTVPLSEVSAYILSGVNEYRASLGLFPVQSSPQTCAFATTRAQEITNGFNHDGFYNRVNDHTIPYNNWSHAVENIAQAPDYKEVVTLWKNSPGHAANMRDNTPYVCIEQNDSYYAYEGMRP